MEGRKRQELTWLASSMGHVLFLELGEDIAQLRVRVREEVREWLRVMKCSVRE